jgi:hypothetical protein
MRGCFTRAEKTKREKTKRAEASRLIHRSAWKKNSRKSRYRMLHKKCKRLHFCPSRPSPKHPSQHKM